MTEHSKQNKNAWEYIAYDFWCREHAPQERARMAVEDPIGQLKRYAGYFHRYDGVRIANICGSCGKKAIPLAVLGADVTVFDISEANKKYALEAAEAARVRLDYQVCDVMELDLDAYGGRFDVVFMEGGVLHYFQDIDGFMRILHALLRGGGRMICSDFHPFTKLADTLGTQQKTMGYFSTEVFEGEVAHARFFDEEVRAQIPLCRYRKYTLGEILNAAIGSGFTLKRFDEHPSWADPSLPGEFTLIAEKG